MLTKSERDLLLITRTKVCLPAGTEATVAVTVFHLCQPPVFATGNVARSVPVGLLSRASIEPPSALSEAIRALRVEPPMVTFWYFSQSPVASQPTFLPPPVSEVFSVLAPDWAENASACNPPGTATSPASAVAM